MDKASGEQGTKHWSEKEAKAVLEELASSGLDVAEFCRRRGLNPVRVRKWRQRLTAGGPQRPAFLPVEVEGHEAATDGSAAPIEVVANQGWVVRVPPGCSAEALRSVLAALREVSLC